MNATAPVCRPPPPPARAWRATRGLVAEGLAGARRGRALFVLAPRLRPILLTTATTVCGLFPLAVAGGPLFSPMATAMLSGLLIATWSRW
ncbi:MAG TPA: efflux RND transporter permease subunit [Myxococcales bacterium LLY-WYZ-16_1]|nr:efflux RND transporter permease subunit [Myxococcales bacterium LLY-WYZ-16_1]